MKQIRLACALVCLLLALSAAALASAEDTLIVGVPDHGTDGTALQDAMQARYFSTQLLELSKYTNWQYTLVFDTPARLMAQLDAGEINMVLGVLAEDAAGTDCVLPQYASGYREARIVAPWENTSIQKYSFHSIENLRIAAYDDALALERLHGFLATNGIGADVIVHESIDAAIALLQAGGADVALVEEVYTGNLREIIRITIEPFYYAFAPGRDDLARAYDAAFEQILQTDPDYIEDLKRRTGDDSRPLVLTDAERDAIASLGMLRIAVRANNPPTEYYDEDGAACGIYIEIARHIADSIGLTVEPVRADTLRDAFHMVETGEADAMFGVETGGNLERTRRLAMSHAFLDVHRIALVNQNTDLAHATPTIALIPGLEYQLEGFEGAYRYAETFIECADLVNRGEADITYGSPYQVEAALRRRPLRNIQTVTIAGSSSGAAIGLGKPADPALLTALNKAIDRLSLEVIRDITMTQTLLRQENWLVRFLYAYPIPVAIVLFIIIATVTAGSILFHRMQRRHSQALYRTQYIDPLTGALNLSGLRREEARIVQYPGKCAVSYVAIRNFQYLNDHYGYEAGDEVLRRIAALYRKHLRPDELFSRVGGRSFVAVRHYDDEAALRARLDGFHTEAAGISPGGDSQYHLRLTAGVYLSDSPQQRESLFAMIDRANAAQKEIIRFSEIKYDVYREGLFDRLLNSQALESRMEAALAEGAFHLYLQPKINLMRMQPVGAEALVRWQEGDYTMLPGAFIGLFERNGFIARLDRYMLEQCCQTIRQWLDSGMPVVPISVNVSRVLLYKAGFVQDYIAVKDAYDIPDGLIELEFTESIFTEDTTFFNDIIQSFRQRGFRCSIDDFGKGYSSLTMLKNIQVDVIKLDAQFFSGGVDGQRDTIVIESVLELAKSLQMDIVAEGIERVEQMRYLKMIGCEIAQGFLFARPLKRPVFETYLRQVVLEGKPPFAQDSTEAGM